MKKFWQKKQTKASQTQSSFKNIFSLAERAQRSSNLAKKYPSNKLCLVVIEGLHELPSKNPSKPSLVIGLELSMTIIYLIAYVKKTLCISESTSLFVEVNSNVMPMTATMGDIAAKYTEQDGFVYLRLKAQDTF